MRRIDNRRKKFAWLLLLVYVPMLLAITFHHHSGGGRNCCVLLLRLRPPYPPRRTLRFAERCRSRMPALSVVCLVLCGAGARQSGSFCACRLCCLPCGLSFCQDARRQRSFNACATCVLISVAFQKTICFSGSSMLEKLMTSNDL